MNNEQDVITRQEYNNDCKEMRKGIEQNRNDIIKLETLYSVLSPLSEAINELNIEMAKMGRQINNLGEKIEKISSDNESARKKISQIDGKGKIDVLDYIKNNFEKIIIVGYICFQILSKFI